MPTPDDALLNLSDAYILPEGHIRFTVKRRDGEALRVSCPTVEVGDIVFFLVSLAKGASEQQGLGMGPPVMSHLTPIPATGIGFSAGMTPEETLLVVNLSGFALSFAMTSSGLLRLADDIARTAKTLAAPADRKN